MVPPSSSDCLGFATLPAFIAGRVARFEHETVRGDRCAHSIVLGAGPAPADIDLRSNDYLAIGAHRAVLDVQISQLRACGNRQMMSAVFLTPESDQSELEQRFAGFLKTGASVLFQSGYQANTGLLQTIAQAGTPVYADQMAHASIYQGAVVAGADLRAFRHNDVEHLRRQIAARGPGIVVIDSVYSTDGSVAPVADVLDVAEETGCALVVDESHSLGTHGPAGAGVVVGLGLQRRVHFRTASLAKAFCGRAGLVACPARFSHYLRFASYPSIFSSAVLPHELAAFACTLEIVASEEWRRERLRFNAHRLRAGLLDLGYNVAASGSQIIALEAGTEARVVKLAAALQRRGVFGSPFFAPATAKNRACIRLSVSAGLCESDLARILDVCAEIRDEVELSQWGSTRRISRCVRRFAAGQGAQGEVEPGSGDASPVPVVAERANA